MSCGLMFYGVDSMLKSHFESEKRVEAARVDLLTLKLSKNDRQIIKRVQKQYHLDSVSYSGESWLNTDFKYKLEYSNFDCEGYSIDGSPERFEFYFNEL
jgi:hypothetical protein